MSLRLRVAGLTQSALYMTINPVFYARSKHIEIDYHFVSEKVIVGALITQYIPFTHQAADIFTKPLAFSKQAWSSLCHSLQFEKGSRESTTNIIGTFHNSPNNGSFQS